MTLSSSVTDLSQAETAAGYTYAWSVLRNGSPYTLPGNPSTSGPSLVFAPTLGGSYAISLSTTDSSGSVGIAPAQTIFVNNVAPTASFTGLPATDPAGTAITLTGSATDPSTAVNAAGYTFSWTVSGPSTNLTGSRRFPSASHPSTADHTTSA